MSVSLEYRDRGVAIIELNRPEKRNALNIPLMEELLAAIEEANGNDAVRVICLTGAGPAFCSGLDLEVARDQEGIEMSADLLMRLFLTLHHSLKVTLASVQGAAIAGGLGLAIVCDIAIGEEDAKFGLPEVRRGLVPAVIIAFLRRLIPERRLRELVLTGRLVDAKRAYEIGLISEVVKSGTLKKRTDEVIGELLKGAPGAIFHTKTLLDQLHAQTIEEALCVAEHAHRLSRESPEGLEGINAFFEKRPPNWEK